MSSIIKSDNGVSSGVTGIVQIADSSGQLAFQTTNSAGTAVTALTINNSQIVTFANQLTAASMPTGSVIQVVQGVSTTGTVSTTSATYTSTGFTTTITPLLSTSKILILFTGGFSTFGSAPNNGSISIRSSINGGSYSSVTGNTNDIQLQASNSTATVGMQWSWSYLYSPSTTNSVAITPYFNSTASGNTQFYINYNGSSGTTMQITLMEIR